jgi:uncharacterized membrane protein YqjE
MTRMLLISLIVLGVLGLAVAGWTVRAARWVALPSARRRRLVKRPRLRLAPAPRPAFA